MAKDGTSVSLQDKESIFGMPGHRNGGTESFINEMLYTSDAGTEHKTGKAKSNTAGLYEEQLATDESMLDQNNGDNIAKTGGVFGRINNKDYDTTLRLAREADKYNSAPVADRSAQGHWRGSGVYHNLGPGYKKPELDTMETKTTAQDMQLDKNQKMLAQGLQDAVNRKDLDAFRMYYAQRYGIELSEMQAEVAMIQFARQQQMTNMLTKDLTTFGRFFGRAFDAQTVAAMYNTGKNDPLFGNMLSSYIIGMPTPAMSDYSADAFKQNYLREKFGDNWQDASAKDIAQAGTEAETQLNRLYRNADSYAAGQIGGPRGWLEDIGNKIKGTFGD